MADLLNLIVGGSKETKLFWSEVVCEKLEKKFNIVYKEDEINRQYVLAGVI